MVAHARVALCVALAVVGQLAAQELASGDGGSALSYSSGHAIYELSDEEYYAMPKLFELDDYSACLSQRGVYCVGSFELSAPPHHQLFQRMTGWSNNWVDNYNHTRLHRGLCVSKQCPTLSGTYNGSLDSWFETCVNESTTSDYNISARLYQLDYCQRGHNDGPPLSTNQRAFAAMVAAVIALAAISTALDLTLSDHATKDIGWALSWSVRRSWRALTAPVPRDTTADLRTFNGLRVFCMMSIILEHVVWLSTQNYTSNTRYIEQTRRSPDVVLMTNSTLVVQIFFIMSSYLLAQKLLQQRQKLPLVKTFLSTLVNRIIRLSPSYFMVIWFSGTWWERVGTGPLWAPLVGGEAAICRRKWWTHLVYLNNVIYPDDKCLIQTWYLAADMQLYIAALLLTLMLRGRRAAILVLGTLFFVVTGLNFTLSYLWRLVPNFVLHRPESIRSGYAGEASFNVLYQSPLGNAAGTIGGLLLAHLHYRFRNANVRIADNKVFRWVSTLCAPGALWWAAAAPLLASSAALNGRAAALAAFERPVFIVLVVISLLGAINWIKSPWRTWLSHFGAVLPRLSFGALLLHLPLTKILLASRTSPVQLDRSYAILEWFGVGVATYICAVPLALLVELPTQALHRELTKPRRINHDPTREKLDKNDNNM